MKGDAGVNLEVPLKFLRHGQWTLRSFADRPGAD